LEQRPSEGNESRRTFVLESFEVGGKTATSEQPMYFGVDYYPEHWVYPYAGSPSKPEERWEKDIGMMIAAGVNVVRMGEFAWGLYEREEGNYDFEWMRRAMDLFGRAGIKVVLGTPTAAPPIWLAKKHPEILPIDERGLRKHQGTRRAYCLNSDVYWEYSQKILRALDLHPRYRTLAFTTQLRTHPAAAPSRRRKRDRAACR